MPAEWNTHTRNNNATPSTPNPYCCPLGPARNNNSLTSGAQRAPTPYPSHLQTLEERFPSQQESDDSSLEFLDEGGIRYPFAPLSNVTCQPFLIPGPSETSNSDAIVLHQFPGPLEIPQNTSEVSTGSYHVAPIQVFSSLSPINVSSSPNPDSPTTASTDSPNMPPLTSNVSDNGSITFAPNLQLLANISEYVIAFEGGHSSNPQEFVVYSNDMIQCPTNDITRAWQSISFNTSTPVQDVDPLERVLPYFPGAYANFVT
ncbi:uncharacterized protein FIBRA_09218 [Fibroporia radiculosa]|uniref:Uncharacterized protein n=1 Tax=Fibroporia radiculosa TaxID=599839 RepID=J7RH60_9APHY|nr:uncharacterized protein FIBRA_09218 [Fibroporia radiculosa]CCM06907.1 predicted protein [Fibroporia radiculosa]